MVARATRADAYNLIHEGTLALADVERNGIRVDEEYLQGAIDNVDRRIDRLSRKLEHTDVWKVWKRRFGDKAKLGSKPQLGAVLAEELGFKNSLERNKKGYTVDEKALSNIDIPFVGWYLKREKLKKAKGTYLLNIQREVVNGYIRCFFNLHTVRTYRSSADRINLQNQPTRDPEMSKIIRSCFIARDGHQLLEIDYGALEVRGIACYCKDPVLIEEVERDPHTQWAMAAFMIDKEQVNKTSRYVAKNQIVFPLFYGSYYVDCAKNMWETMAKMELMAGDVSIREHLKSLGIKELGACDPEQKPRKGTFEYHIKQVEDDFRHKHYKQHTKWREDWWNKYKQRGYLDTLTGFRLSEVYRRNQVVNSPVQGSCFHCLLWSLTQLNKWLRKNKMRSRIVCQIHDSMLLDVHPSELEDVLAMAKHISTVAIRKHWKWIIVPLAIEAELCPVGGTWYDKKGIELP